MISALLVLVLLPRCRWQQRSACGEDGDFVIAGDFQIMSWSHCSFCVAIFEEEFSNFFGGCREFGASFKSQLFWSSSLYEGIILTKKKGLSNTRER